MYRGTSPTRKRTLLGPYCRPMPRVLGGSQGGPRGQGVFLWARYPCTPKSCLSDPTPICKILQTCSLQQQGRVLYLCMCMDSMNLYMEYILTCMNYVKLWMGSIVRCMDSIMICTAPPRRASRAGPSKRSTINVFYVSNILDS